MSPFKSQQYIFKLTPIITTFKDVANMEALALSLEIGRKSFKYFGAVRRCGLSTCTLHIYLFQVKTLFRLVAVASSPHYVLLQVWILCNDCGGTNEVRFHLVAHKCPAVGCGSYNTRQTRASSATPAGGAGSSNT